MSSLRMRWALACCFVLACSSGAGEPQTELHRIGVQSPESPGSKSIPSSAQSPGTLAAGTREPQMAPRAEDRAPEPAYALDPVSRKVPLSGTLSCPPVELVDYRGTILPLQKRARLYEGFAEHLPRFEEIVRDTAIEIYGRPPSAIRHVGAYYCRRIRTWGYLISEHGLGNALDVEGFDFARASKLEIAAGTDWRPAFRVSMSKHWNAESGAGAVHRSFLRLLATRIIEEEGLFRVILGPADPKHKGHFHFDMAPFRIVNVF